MASTKSSSFDALACILSKNKPAYRRDTELIDLDNGTISRGPDLQWFHNYGTATTFGTRNNLVLVAGGARVDKETNYSPSINQTEGMSAENGTKCLSEGF